MSIDTHFYRDHHHVWAARSECDLEGGKHLLKVHTYKSFNQALVTRVSGWHIEDGFARHTLFEDYSTDLLVTHPSRVTRLAVEIQHAQALAASATWQEAAKAHYADKPSTAGAA